MQNPFQNSAQPSGAGSNEWYNNGGGGGGGGGFQSSFPGHPMQMQQEFNQGGGEQDLELENEPPLLEELGINLDDVLARIKAVVLFKPLDHQLVLDGDLTGPLMMFMGLLIALLLQGKTDFAAVYSIVVFSILFSYILINLMAQKGSIDLYCAASMFGYGLLPVVLLAFVNVFLNLKNWGILGLYGVRIFLLGAATVFWCTATSSRFVKAAVETTDQQWLIAYQNGLMYMAFVVIAVF